MSGNSTQLSALFNIAENAKISIGSLIGYLDGIKLPYKHWYSHLHIENTNTKANLQVMTHIEIMSTDTGCPQSNRDHGDLLITFVFSLLTRRILENEYC